MNKTQPAPALFEEYISAGFISRENCVGTDDGFFAVSSSIAQLLAGRGILELPDSDGGSLPCERFFDDWYLYAVPTGTEHVYSLFKLREQEHDTEDGAPADGDIPGVTVSFIAFSVAALTDCLEDPSQENRRALAAEIDRVVVRRGQRHHPALKAYFLDPRSRGAYLLASLYARHIAAMSRDGAVEVPMHYKKLVQQSESYKKSAKFCRLPKFIDSLNHSAGRTVCDHERIYIANPASPTQQETAAILATHTGNTSVYSFAAEVEYHAKYLVRLARLRIPFFGKSIYESAIRADMTVDDREFEGPAPFHKEHSGIVRRQRHLHSGHFSEEQ